MPNDELSRRESPSPAPAGDGDPAKQVRSPLRLLSDHTIVDGPEDAIATARKAISLRQPIVFEGLVDPRFLQLLTRVLASARFEPSAIERIGVRTTEVPGIAGDALCLALGRPDVLELMTSLIGGKPLTGVAGAVARIDRRSRGYLDWHDDLAEPQRRLAITINLGDRSYRGGEFESRDLDAPGVLFRHLHTRAGDALIFPIGPGLQHRVLPVTGGGPRMVFAGWFLGNPF